MARTTSTLVIGILGRDYDSQPEVGSPPSLTPYIDTASALVDDVVANAAALGLPALAVGRLELIERWLSAHYYQQSDQGFQSKSTDGASASFKGQTSKGLNGTQYGQSAITLDTTKYLQKIAAEVDGNQAKTATLLWLGKNPTDQIDYETRR